MPTMDTVASRPGDFGPFDAAGPVGGAPHITPDEFKQSMRLLAGGVCILATSREGTRLGLTATSICSLTLDPPMIVVCVNRNAGAHDIMLETRRISVNVLGEDQLDVARRFASPEVRGPQRFDHAWTESHLGQPVLQGALASLECEVTRAFSVGQHSVFFCSVKAAQLSAGKSALVHFDRQFCSVSEIA